MNLQQMLDQDSYHIFLPEGFLRGPAVIRHPCNVYGKNAILWANQGPVLTVESPGVILHGFRVCLKGSQGVCIRTNSADTALVSVTLLGALEGFPNEQPEPLLPGLIHLGMFAPSPAVNQIPLSVPSPAAFRLSHSIQGAELSSRLLLPGENRILLTLRGIKAGHVLYGTLEAVREGETRREIHLLGQAAAGVSPRFPSPDWHTFPYAAAGEKISLQGRRLRIRIAPPPPEEYEVEPFVFLLDGNGQTRSDDDLIFYNHAVSGWADVEDGQTTGNRNVRLYLGNMPPAVNRAAVCFSVTSEKRRDLNFSLLKERLLYVEDMETGGTVCVLPLDVQEAVQNLRAVEVYRAGSQWKLWCRNQAYPSDLASLCREYGLEVSQ